MHWKNRSKLVKSNCIEIAQWKNFVISGADSDFPCWNKKSHICIEGNVLIGDENMMTALLTIWITTLIMDIYILHVFFTFSPTCCCNSQLSFHLSYVIKTVLSPFFINPWIYEILMRSHDSIENHKTQPQSHPT